MHRVLLHSQPRKVRQLGCAALWHLLPCDHAVRALHGICNSYDHHRYLTVVACVVVRQEDYDRDFLWEPSDSKPPGLEDVQRCLGVLESDMASPYWCHSLRIIAKLLQHMQDESRAPLVLPVCSMSCMSVSVF